MILLIFVSAEKVSWLSQIEIYFSVAQQKVLTPIN